VTVYFIVGGKRNTCRKPLICQKVTDKLDHIVLYQDTSPQSE